MGYLIVYVRPKNTGPEQKPIGWASRRAQLSESSIVGPGWAALTKLVNSIGFEVHFGVPPVPNGEEWPFTCVAYTSRRKDGQGRTGSAVYRFPCRRIEMKAPPRARDTGQFLKTGACPECGTHGPHPRRSCRLCGSELPPHLQPAAPEEPKHGP